MARERVTPIKSEEATEPRHVLDRQRAIETESVLETIGQDYMRTARAKGLAERVVVMRHALKNAAIPLVTVVALDVPELFVGALVTEQIFGWPGMGRLFWDAATRSDYPVLQGILVVSSTLIVLANLFADVMYGYLDPRIRFS